MQGLGKSRTLGAEEENVQGYFLRLFLEEFSLYAANTYKSCQKTYYGFDGCACSRLEYGCCPIAMNDKIGHVVTMSRIGYSVLQYAGALQRNDHVPVRFQIIGATLCHLEIESQERL